MKLGSGKETKQKFTAAKRGDSRTDARLLPRDAADPQV